MVKERIKYELKSIAEKLRIVEERVNQYNIGNRRYLEDINVLVWIESNIENNEITVAQNSPSSVGMSYCNSLFTFLKVSTTI